MLEIPDVHYTTDGSKLVIIEQGEDAMQLTYEESLVFRERFEAAFEKQQSEK